ncbi:MAG: sensor histidine kinase [Candidatus Faecivicinus sp.]
MTRLKKLISSVVRHFLDRSIRTQYVAAALLMAAALLVSSTYVFLRAYTLSRDDHIQNALSDFENAYSALDKFEKRMLHLASLVQSDTSAVGLLSQSSALSYSEYLRTSQELLPLLYTLSDGSDDYFCRLYVDYALGNADSSSRILPLSDAMACDWAQDAMAGWGWWRFYSGAALGARSPALLAPIRSLSDHTQLVALFRVDLRMAALEDMLAAPQAEGFTTCYLEDASGNLVARNGLPLESPIPEDCFSDFDAFDATELHSFVNGRDTVFYRQLPSSRWRLTMVVHHGVLFSLIFPQFCLLTLGALAMMMLGVLCASPILGRTMARIRRFSAHVQNYNEAGSEIQAMPVRLTPDARDEIGQLIAAHNAMLDRIHALMEEKQSREQELRRLEIHALQAQIKPHFLYNTLEAVTWMARLNQPERVESTLRSLTRFYRLCLSKGRDLLTLAEELEIVENYFTIERMRYEQVFSLYIDVAPELMQVQLPKITLQPLVENALVHGILESGHDSGEVRIYTRVPPEGPAELCIADSGAHFSPEAFRRALTQDAGGAPEAAGEGYGIKNVERRLQLFFQQPQVLYLDTGDPAFTCLVLPLYPPAGSK